jgi:small GTP-binding protein
MIRETIQAKVTVIGNANVGKSSIIHRFINEETLDNSEPTIGANFLTKILDFEKYSIKLSIWDTAGQERYSSLAASYTRGSTACLLIYDITNYESFLALDKWYKLIKDNLDPDCILFILGNKEDLIGQEKVTLQQAKDYCGPLNFSHFRISAKTGVGVEDVFIGICKKLMGTDVLVRMQTAKTTTRGFSVCMNPVEPPKKRKCCSV